MKAISHTWKIMSYITAYDTRGVTMHLAPEMRQNTETWFKILQYDFKETFNDRIFVLKKQQSICIFKCFN